jgi:hypothetical protein
MQPGVSLTRQAHDFIEPSIIPGALAIDATAGNGYDLEFLCRGVSPGGVVYGFDVQAVALERCRLRLAEQGLKKNARLMRAGHEEMTGKIATAHRGKINAIMFNLGYLPGGDHSITTCADSTLAALDASLKILSPTGRLSVLCYRGHPGGKEEAYRVQAWCRKLSGAQYDVRTAQSVTPGPETPLLVMVRKLPI